MKIQTPNLLCLKEEIFGQTPGYPIQVIGMDIDELQNFVLSIGEKPFRAKQIFKWLYQKHASDFSIMSDLPLSLREKLSERAEIGPLRFVRMISSPSGAVKFIFQISSGESIESVFIPEGKRRTVCVSTQTGCPLGCLFCNTGKIKRAVNLTAGEIIDQLIFIVRELDIKITNVVFMGMGEPFFNFDNCIKAAVLMNSEMGMSIAAKKITISTAGLVPQIKRFADEEYKFNLAISLNAPDDELRSKLMPVNRKHPLKELLKAVKYYSKKSKNRVTFEYVLIDHLNDTPSHGRKLIEILHSIPCKLNLIAFNMTGDNFKKPSTERINRFIEVVYKAPFPVTLRKSKGEDIHAACGQLAGGQRRS